MKMEKIKDLKRVLNSLRLCTQPCDGHTDPNSIDDCWNWVEEIINDIEKSNEKLIHEILDKASDVCVYGYQSLNKEAVLELKKEFITSLSQ